MKDRLDALRDDVHQLAMAVYGLHNSDQKRRRAEECLVSGDREKYFHFGKPTGSQLLLLANDFAKGKEIASRAVPHWDDFCRYYVDRGETGFEEIRLTSSGILCEAIHAEIIERTTTMLDALLECFPRERYVETPKFSVCLGALLIGKPDVADVIHKIHLDYVRSFKPRPRVTRQQRKALLCALCTEYSFWFGDFGELLNNTRNFETAHRFIPEKLAGIGVLDYSKSYYAFLSEVYCLLIVALQNMRSVSNETWDCIERAVLNAQLVSIQEHPLVYPLFVIKLYEVVFWILSGRHNDLLVQFRAVHPLLYGMTAERVKVLADEAAGSV